MSTACWVWGNTQAGSMKVPEVVDLKKAAHEMLKVAWEGAHRERTTYSVSSGGLRTTCFYWEDGSVLRLSFEIDSYQCEDDTDQVTSEIEQPDRRIDLSL